MNESDVELSIDRGIAKQLSRSWAAFFGRFGRLLPIQRRAIPFILSGRNTLLCAPTAGGKTEAAAAPIAELLLRDTDPDRALYIVPTRALANDLVERLSPAATACGLSVGLRTGDHRGRGEEAIVLTTPESFDSLLCRGGSGSGHLLDDVGIVVLDEVHLLASSARGEQARWLLSRLDRLRAEAFRTGRSGSPRVQRIALSATVGDPRQVADDFLGAESEVAIVAGSRPLEVVPESLSGTAEATLPCYLARVNTDAKVLVFCNTRRRVDELTLNLRALLFRRGFSVHAHHGSLAAGPREEAEREFRQRSHIVVVASSTLEIGIDVGDVDLVVLDAAPPDISSLLQRIGRGNRRRGTTRVLACGARPGHVLIQTALLGAARDGVLGPSAARPRLSAMRQQVLSYTFQAREKRRRLATFEQLAGSSSLATTQEMQTLVDSMLRSGDLSGNSEYLRLGPKWDDSPSSLHSVIEDSGGMRVVDDRTGESLATGIKYRGGDGLTTGGKSLKIKGADGKVIRTSKSDATTSEGDWSYAARKLVVGPSQGFAIRRHLGIGSDEWPVLSDGDLLFVFHLGGVAHGILAELVLQQCAIAGVAAGPFALQLSYDAVEAFARGLASVTEHQLHGLIERDLDRVERRLGLPYANGSIAVPLRLAEIASALGLPAAVEYLQRVRMVPAGPQSDALRSLLEPYPRQRVRNDSRIADA